MGNSCRSSFLGLLAVVGLTMATYARASSPALLVQDPETLAQLEDGGISIGRVMGAHGVATVDNAKLFSESPTFRTIVAHIDEELSDRERRDPKLRVTMAGSHRLFDVRWLKSKDARFELAGVVNRLDRRPFHSSQCGETRLIFRLRYKKKISGQTVASRLPFTFNAVYWQAPDASGKCAAVAERWRALEGLSGAKLTTALLSDHGPLATSHLGPKAQKSIELNFQAVRWPSTIRPDLAAHAEYILRVFSPNAAGKWELSPLENTPDVERMRRDPALKKRFLAWIREPKNLVMIEDGVPVMPDEFLARRISSFSPRGLTRLANRPYDRLFDEADFAGLDFSKGRHVRSAAGLMRRLDDLTCAGCHQSRPVAGFHFLGIDRPDTSSVNFVHVTGSPHLLRDQVRRGAFLAAVAAGRDGLAARPLSERADEGDSGYGSHCGLGDKGFAHWTCDPGLSCQGFGNASGDKTVGQCFAKGEAEVGDPCEVGTMKMNEDPTKDRVVDVRSRDCGNGGVCYVNYGGFPEGMCGIACETKDKNAACGAIAILKDFNGCLAKGGLFTQCVEDNVDPLGLRRCDDANPCRDDYLCVRTKRSEGTCIPPYFLFQMRVDGHPRP